MSPIAAKVTAIERRVDRYQVIFQISPKYRGSFNTLAFGEIKPHSGSLRDGRLDLVYYQNPVLSVEDPFPLWTLHRSWRRGGGDGPNSCATMNRFWRWGSIGPRPRQWPGRLIPGLSPALFGGTGKRSRCLLGGGKSLNPLVLSKALFPFPQA